MRREIRQLFLLGFLIAVSIPLLGAQSAFPAPVVVVYPFTVSENADSEAGSNIAILFSTRLMQLGGIVVKPYTPGTDRPQYLAASLAMGADYYVSGFTTPIGGREVSIVTQLVSTASGTVVYSATTLATTYADAASEAETLHDVILAHATRGLAGLGAPRPTATPTPLGNDVGKVLRRRSHAKPSPSPSAAAAAAASLPASGSPPPAAGSPSPAASAPAR